MVADLDRLAVVLAMQTPAWEPGTRQATLGFYEGELLRRIDPRHRSLGQFFQDEIASPLGEDVYIRVPEEIPNSRLATDAPHDSVLDATSSTTWDLSLNSDPCVEDTRTRRQHLHRVEIQFLNLRADRKQCGHA